MRHYHSIIMLYLLHVVMVENFLGDLEWEGSEVDTEMPDITLDDTKMLMLGEGSSTWDSGQEQSGSRDLMVFRGQQQDQDSPAMETTPTSSVLALPSSVPMEVERIMSVALPAYISVNHHGNYRMSSRISVNHLFVTFFF